MKTNMIKMKSALRKLEQESSYSEIFETYEREQIRMTKEIERLMNENIALEEKIYEFELEKDSADGKKRSGKTNVVKALQEAKEEIKELKTSNNTLKRQERLLWLSHPKQ